MRSPLPWPWLIAMGSAYLGITVLTHLHQMAGAGALLLGLFVFRRPLALLLRQTLVQSWRAINRETGWVTTGWVTTALPDAGAPGLEQGSGLEQDRPLDLRPLLVLCTVAVSLTLIEYFGDRGTYDRIMRRFFARPYLWSYYELCSYSYWTLARVAGYVFIPWLVVLVTRKERIRDHGLAGAGFLKHMWIYVLLFLLVLPAVVMVSFAESFTRTYPFYRLASRSWVDLLSWEALYALQFLALEVFFRGYIVHSLKHTLGVNAIFVMVVPYCMIHYSKPLPEVLGAVAAGIVLGTLSLRTGSIWCGVLIHISVAWTMDLLALIHTAGLPGWHQLVALT